MGLPQTVSTVMYRIMRLGTYTILEQTSKYRSRSRDRSSFRIRLLDYGNLLLLLGLQLSLGYNGAEAYILHPPPMLEHQRHIAAVSSNPRRLSLQA